MKVHQRLFESEIPLDQVSGGLGDNKPDHLFDQDQLLQGIIVEFEHTDDVDIATEIAKDHLTENPKYYDELKKIEPEHFPEEKTSANYSHSIHEAVNELVSIYRELSKTSLKSKNKILSKLKDSLTYLVQADKLISIETENPSIGDRLKIK